MPQSNYTKKKEELLNIKCQISKHQQNQILLFFELLASCTNKSTQFLFFGSNLQALAKPKQKRKHNFRIVAPMHQHNNKTIKPTRKSKHF
jgi:hypothetical protein